MSPNKRIFLNIAATYGRSLFSLACGLFTARWVLMALGQEDFGLYGVVGGMTVFIAFFNTLLSGSLGRFYAFAIGEAQTGVAEDWGDKGLENCRRWFNTALSIHIVAPAVLMLIGYPVGEWMVRHFLTIPPEKIVTCVWVYRLTCISCFVAMINVPFTAMYTAKQYIAELTLYSVAQTAANTVFFYFMASHPGDWLLKYAGWMCLVGIVPQIFICIRAFKVFPECRIRLAFWWDLDRIRKVSGYAFWQMFGGLGYLFRTQGIAILVNKCFGAGANAAMSIANQASSQTQTLVAAMSGAFQPAIATAYGSGDMMTMRKMAYRASKFGLVLMLIFLIPLALELPEVLRLWLKNPPPSTTGLCWLMMAMLLVDKASIGQSLACNASGKIAAYQSVGGTMLIVCLPLAWLFLTMGGSIYYVGVAMVITTSANTLSRVFFAQKIASLSMRHWLFRIILPVVVVGVVSAVPGIWIVQNIQPSFLRVCLTIICSELVLIPLIMLVVIDSDERLYVRNSISRLMSGKK